MDVEDAKAKLGDKVKLVSGDAKTVNGAGDSTEKNGDSAEAEVRNDFISSMRNFFLKYDLYVLISHSN